MSSEQHSPLGLERMLFFSDAVFAIAITLLALELKVPGIESMHEDSLLLEGLIAMIPAWIGFLLSFLLIGQTWIEHHRIGGLLTGEDRGLLWWNLLILLFVVIMPFAAALVSEYATSRIAIVVYGLTFLGLGLSKVLFWSHANRSKLVPMSHPYIRDIGSRIWATPIVALLVVLLAWAGVPYAYFGFALIPLVMLLLTHMHPAGRARR